MKGAIALILSFVCLLAYVITASAAPLAQTTVDATDAKAATEPAQATPAEACYPLLPNSGFEEYADWVLPNTTTPADYTGSPSYAGFGTMRLGIPAEGDNLFSYSVAYQWINIPKDAGRVTLTAQLWRSSTGKADGDKQYVLIGIPGIANRLPVNGFLNTATWEPTEIDLSDYKGRTIGILLGVYNNGTGAKTVMYADEVWVMNCK